MCTNKECSLSESCKRSVAIPKHLHQSYCHFTPLTTKNGIECNMFVPVSINEHVVNVLTKTKYDE